MPLRRPALALVAAAVLVAVPVVVVQPSAVGAVVTPSFSQSWTRQVAAGRAVSTSSPVLVANGSQPFVAAADNAGNVRAFDLTSGTPVSGWSSTNVGFGVRAPLSSDGSNVYVPVATDGIARYPLVRKFNASGQAVWSSNTTTVLPSNPAVGFLLSGLSLGPSATGQRGYLGSSGQWVYGVDAATGAQRWAALNADSTMATPAVADLYGSGTPAVVTSNDTSPAFAGDRAGGLLRIFTADGTQVCSATQFVNGLAYAASGYNNSSPSVGVVDGRPLIVFGSTGPVQTGDGGNQVVAYDADCTLRWASPALAARVEPSPVLADVTGTGSLDVVQLLGIADGANTYPRVVVLDGSTGAITADTGTSLRSYGAALAYPSSMSVATADVDADGAQDLFVPARQGSLLVLSGRTLGVLTTINTNLVVQNTPVVTATPTGVRITLAGYNGLGAQISSYTTTGGTLGARGWHHFGGNPQLTGVQGTLSGPFDQLLEGRWLGSGQSVRRGSATLTMQTDGNLVARSSSGVTFYSGTTVPGSGALMHPGGYLEVRTPTGAVAWRSPGSNYGFERLVLKADGTLAITSGDVATVRQLAFPRDVWRSNRGATPWDRLVNGEQLGAERKLFSADGTAVLTVQGDGNVVIFRLGTLMWQSKTKDPALSPVLVMQSDGNLVVYSTTGRLLGSYNTYGKGAVAAVLGNDGVLRVQTAAGKAVWASNGVVK